MIFQNIKLFKITYNEVPDFEKLTGVGSENKILKNDLLNYLQMYR